MAHVRSRRVPPWVAATLAVTVLAVACAAEPPPPPDPVSWNQVLNASVPGDTVGAEQITLTAGHYSVLTGDLGGAIDISLHDLHAAGDLDGNNVQDEVGILVEGYEPSYTDQWVKAVHCYHNLVIIEKGDNREGTNRDHSAHSFHGGSDLPEPSEA